MIRRNQCGVHEDNLQFLLLLHFCRFVLDCILAPKLRPHKIDFDAIHKVITKLCSVAVWTVIYAKCKQSLVTAKTTTNRSRVRVSFRDESSSMKDSLATSVKLLMSKSEIDATRNVYKKIIFSIYIAIIIALNRWFFKFQLHATIVGSKRLRTKNYLRKCREEFDVAQSLSQDTFIWQRENVLVDFGWQQRKTNKRCCRSGS